MYIHVNHVDIYYEIEGQGAPLILVHGNGEDHSIFDEAVKLLSPHFTCILMDSRGHGQSSPVDSLDYDSMAEDVLALCHELKLEKPYYYGFSDGGIIGLLAGMKEPDYFKRMVISGANIHPRGVLDRIYYLFKIMYFVKKDPKIRMMLEQPNIDPEALSVIETPTLVLAGSKDLIKEAHTRQIAASLKRSKLKILKGEGHGSYIVHSQKIARLILKFCLR